METNERTPIFTNVYAPNEQTDRQIYSHITRVRRIVYWVICTGFFAFLVYQLVDTIRWTARTGASFFAQTNVWILLAGIALYVVLFILLILAPRRFIKKRVKQMRELYGEKRVEIRAAFFDDAVAFHNAASNADLKHAYSVFKQVAETKDLFLLRSEQKMVLALDKSGFDGVDVPGFRAFMDEKCPNAKRGWKKES